MSILKDRVMKEIKEAMKSREKDRLATLRLMSAALKQVEVDKRYIIESVESSNSAIKTDSLQDNDQSGEEEEEEDAVILKNYELNDNEIISIFEKMKSQRKDSIKQYIKAGRDDLAQQENSEIIVIEEFLPLQLSADELNHLVQEAILLVGAKSLTDIAKVMEFLQPKITGRASSKDVGALIRNFLGSTV